MQTTSVAGTLLFQDEIFVIASHFSTVPPNLMLVSEVQSSNAPPPILVTESGIATLVSDVQPLNAPLPILVTESGITTLVSDEQPLNAESPILVTSSGSVTLVSEVQK